MIYSDPRWYDTVYGGFRADIPFFAGVAQASDGPVCELACGTGRVGIPLLEAGNEYTGIDRSGEMIAAARSKAGPGQERYFIEGDMSEFRRVAGFGAIIVPLHSFSHLTNPADVNRTMENVVASLRPGGLFALSLHNPAAGFTGRDPDALYPLESTAEWSIPADTVERVRFDADSGLTEVTWFFADDTAAGFLLRLYEPQEIVSLLTRHGFAIEGHWGWYDRSLLGPDSGTQVLLCKKKRCSPNS